MSQVSLVQALLSLQSESPVHWMHPPRAGSQVKPVLQLVLSGVLLHLPLTHLSVVQAMRSSQSASAQQALQPEPSEQHLPPLAQVLNEQLPFTHLPVPALHGSSLVHCESLTHCAVWTQPVVTSQVKPDLQVT